MRMAKSVVWCPIQTIQFMYAFRGGGAESETCRDELNRHAANMRVFICS